MMMNHLLLPDGIWYIVKQFAGIYHITTEWHRTQTLPVERLHSLAREWFGTVFPDAAWNWTKRKQRAWLLTSLVRNGLDRSKYLKLHELIPNTRKYHIGDEVFIPLTYTNKTPYCGIVSQVTNHTLTVATYGSVIDEEIMKLYWDKNNFDREIMIRIRHEDAKNPIIKKDVLDISCSACIQKYGVDSRFETYHLD